jgi:hypothetical protein
MWIFILLLSLVAFGFGFISNPFLSVDKSLTNSLFKKIGIGLLSISLLMESTYFAKEGHLYYVLNPFGKRSVVSSPGIKFKIPLSTLQEWSKYIDIKAVIQNKDMSWN